MKKTYKIDVDCAMCASKMEDAVKKTPGITSAAINFMTQKLSVEFEDGADLESVMKSVCKNCKKADRDCEIYV